MNYVVSALIITFIIPAFGIVMGMMRKLIFGILSIISPGFAFVVTNYLTFPGVMHHELSHALLGFVTGARITKINLFKPEGMSLGSVCMVYRGPWILRCIQGCMSSVGPVVMGIVTVITTMMYVVPSLSDSWTIMLMYYLIFSIVMHMTMSPSDMKCFLKGAMGVFLLVLLGCVLLEFDIVKYLK